ncbi:hypothetical protein C7N43_37715 [Sphingobacteriales bacterium UPWRP_1]|nr:hypothetical protein BVG80_07720 [Sphingobacteriales bacterium TSM_CSM]PSJ71756.1 hypothetical protein C7N43_37715 [Sphingobacteriales bacterium UPWRP_1]
MTHFDGKRLPEKIYCDKISTGNRNNCTKIGKNGIKNSLAQNMQPQTGNIIKFTIKSLKKHSL